MQHADKLETLPIDSLVPYARNARTHSPEQTGRRCYAMELSAQYVDVAVRRWQQFTGLRAVRESDGVEFPGMTTVTRAEFARMQGVNKSTVTRWAEKGQIVVESGQVNVEASRQRLAETGGARPDVADRHASERGAKVGGGGTAEAAQAAPAPQQDDRVGNSYQAARAVKEKYAALAAKLDYERSSGNLIPKEDVDAALKALGASVRARLDVLADQLAPMVAPVADLDETHAILAEHFRAVLAGISDDLARHEVA